jgi:type IV pilus assembly protein PilB
LRAFPRLPFQLDTDQISKVYRALKVRASIDPDKPGEPQDGHLERLPGYENVQCRLSFIPVIRGEKIVIRLFDQSNRPCKLRDLGLAEQNIDQLRNILICQKGLLLLTGPTGSGKTTTIYSALNELLEQNKDGLSISAVEDPVEVEIAGVAQSQVNRQKGFDYAQALRAVLRQDPQVIMIGEIRDAETAQIAVRAALTGHLVLSTIHATSTSAAFLRLMSLNIEPFLITSSVVGVLGQRLIRENCEKCKIKYEPRTELLDKYKLPKQHAYYKGHGCGLCDYGYTKRFALS